MKKIGIFCGCFNPVHQGHIRAAESFITAGALDYLYLVPANSQYSKFNGYIESGEHRLKMCCLAAEEYDRIGVCDYEIMQPEAPYTMDTVLHIKELYPNDEIYLCMGEDTAKKLCLWACFDDLKKNVRFLIVSRYSSGANFDWLSESGAYVICIERERDGISSTQIRKKLRNDAASIPELNEKVLSYIRDNTLYGISTINQKGDKVYEADAHKDT